MNIKNIFKDKKGVFGLTAVQTFFASILGIALLAYIMIVILGVLGGTTILAQSIGSVTNETGAWLNSTPYTVSYSTQNGFSTLVIVRAYNITNATGWVAIGTGNFTVSGGTITNSSSTVWNNISLDYTYTYNTGQQDDLNSILGNTSGGVTGFFSAISPVYAILAVLVIILILIVLVRVVQAPNREGQSPQL